MEIKQTEQKSAESAVAESPRLCSTAEAVSTDDGELYVLAKSTGSDRPKRPAMRRKRPGRAWIAQDFVRLRP